MVMLGWIFLAISFLSGCVAVPMPPFGDRIGEAGTLHIRATVRFEPRLSDSESNIRDLWNAFGEFQKTLPALKDK